MCRPVVCEGVVNKYAGWYWQCYDEGDHYQIACKVVGDVVFGYSMFITKEEVDTSQHNVVEYTLARMVSVMDSIYWEEK